MKRLKLTKERRERFLLALANTGSVTTAVAVAGTSRTRVYEFRKADPTFAIAWEEAEESAVDRLELEDEARRRAVDGVPEPLVSAGKLVRDDDGQPISVRRYSDNLLMALLKARRRPRRERSWRFQLTALQSAADAARAIASITAAVAAGEITPGEAADLSKLVEAFVKALEASEFDQRLRAIEAMDGQTRASPSGRRDRARRSNCLRGMDRAARRYAARSPRRDNNPRRVQRRCSELSTVVIFPDNGRDPEFNRVPL